MSLTSASRAGVRFNPAKDIPSLAGKVILVTGGNAGLGRQSIIELSKHNPSQIWLAARSLDKARDTVTDIKKQVPDAPIQIVQLDLASLASVKTAVTTFLQSASRLDILMLNAGIMATPEGTTKDGYEIQFGTNHMGHAFLAKLLMPLLLKTAGEAGSTDVRVISLSSAAHNWAPEEGIQFNTLKTKAESMSTLARYGQSKLANILYAREMAKRYPQIKVASVHPGVVDTNLSDSWVESSTFLRIIRPIIMPLVRLVSKSVEDGAKNQLWASTSQEIVSGEYYEPVGVAGKGSRYTQDDELAKRLWEWTENTLQGQDT